MMLLLNELLEDYQEFNEDEAYDEFVKLLWESKYGCRTYKKSYAFKLQPEKLNNNEELIELFSKYENVELRHAISYYKDNPTSIDMIRIHVNNMYMYLTDKDVYLSKEYVNAKISPKKLYFKVIERIKNGEDIDVSTIRNELIRLDKLTEELLERDTSKKIELSFKDYKEMINGYILRIFNNYKPPHEYEEEFGWELNITHDAWHEDNYIIKYMCKSLTGYMMHYVRDNNKKEKICVKCNSLLSQLNRSGYCKSCYEKHRRIYKTTKQRVYRKEI